MGKRQTVLEELLRTQGAVTHNTLAFPRLSDIDRSSLKSEIESVCQKLDGRSPCIPLRLRRWDMEFEGIAVELDEELHFNRYRAKTLDSPAYEKIPGFPLEQYKQHCSEHENDCQKAGGFGGKWSNQSCVSQFGVCSPPGDLTGNGSPWWKQRAFYDFVKDLSPLLIGVRVARIAIWDTLEDGAAAER